MDSQPEGLVSDTLARLLLISRIFGAAPLIFVKKRTGWCITPSPGWSAYGHMLVTMLSFSTFATMVYDCSVGQEQTLRMKSITRRAVWIVVTTLMTSIAGVTVYGASARMHSLITYLNRVHKINCELNVQQWIMNVESKRVEVWVVIWLIITLAMSSSDIVLSTLGVAHFTQKLISVLYTFYYSCYFILQLQELQFIMIALHVMYTFKAINNNLRSLLYDLKKLSLRIPLNNRLFVVNKKFKKPRTNVVGSITASKNSDEVKKPSTPHHEIVRRLVLGYASICDVVREVDKDYGPVLLLLLSSCFIHLVVSAYYLIDFSLEDMSSHNIALNVPKILLQGIWCFYHAANLIMIIEPCYLTHMEMEKTRELVSHLMRCNDSIYDPLSVELELFFRHLILNEVYYSPLKVTTMNRSLVATIFGSITTYLVVIVQI